MTTITLPSDGIAPVGTPDWVSQGTAIEQSRATAQVYAAVLVAQNHRRDVQSARLRALESCRIPEFADAAFYAFEKGRKKEGSKWVPNIISGESVQLARELARCWGNIEAGLIELNRDLGRGASELMAFAWDLETNARFQRIFIVPHARDKSEGEGRDRRTVIDPFTSLRDIQENNGNIGARILREQIFAALPRWYIEAAVEACKETLRAVAENEGYAKAVAAFALMGVPQERLEQHLGKAAKEWSADDLAALRNIKRSIGRGELTVTTAFPDQLATVEELAAGQMDVATPERGEAE